MLSREEENNPMQKWLYLVHSVCVDPAREKEYEEWYDNVHLPDLLTVPGFVRATRYVNKEPMEPHDGLWAEGQGKYLALYEIETEDMKKTWEVLLQHIEEMREKGRRSPLLKVVFRSVWRQESP